MSQTACLNVDLQKRILNIAFQRQWTDVTVRGYETVKSSLKRLFVFCADCGRWFLKTND